MGRKGEDGSSLPGRPCCERAALHDFSISAEGGETCVVKPVHICMRSVTQALKGYVFACGAGCKMALPRDDRSSLGLSQPNLLLQLEIGLVGAVVCMCAWVVGG